MAGIAKLLIITLAFGGCGKHPPQHPAPVLVNAMRFEGKMYIDMTFNGERPLMFKDKSGEPIPCIRPKTPVQWPNEIAIAFPETAVPEWIKACLVGAEVDGQRAILLEDGNVIANVDPKEWSKLWRKQGGKLPNTCTRPKDPPPNWPAWAPEPLSWQMARLREVGNCGGACHENGRLLCTRPKGWLESPKMNDLIEKGCAPYCHSVVVIGGGK